MRRLVAESTIGTPYAVIVAAALGGVGSRGAGSGGGGEGGRARAQRNPQAVRLLFLIALAPLNYLLLLF